MSRTYFIAESTVFTTCCAVKWGEGGLRNTPLNLIQQYNRIIRHESQHIIPLDLELPMNDRVRKPRQY